MKTDDQIQQDIMAELRWQPFLKASSIGVTVRNGIVTLSGTVDSFAKKVVAEKVVKNVNGVRAVAEDLEVQVRPDNRKSDTDIAEAVLRALKWHSDIQEENLKIKVENGFVTLEGQVQWSYEKEMVRDAIRDIAGLNGVINNIIIVPGVNVKVVKSEIEAALGRCACVPSEEIKVDTHDYSVTLTGDVRSELERKAAERAAWNAPGVRSVINSLHIRKKEFVM